MPAPPPAKLRCPTTSAAAADRHCCCCRQAVSLPPCPCPAQPPYPFPHCLDSGATAASPPRRIHTRSYHRASLLPSNPSPPVSANAEKHIRHGLIAPHVFPGPTHRPTPLKANKLKSSRWWAGGPSTRVPGPTHRPTPLKANKLKSSRWWAGGPSTRVVHLTGQQDTRHPSKPCRSRIRVCGGAA
ncbi:hypothetical protein BDA96_07G100000 [Sorghum bicolor]|uniref:Uncharacterized protein n=2 Tax=Sorghum bicolor TaxID=4558 RepID=A0A921QMH8_SORBI|nr:hypothetical protein BDA96_07G100000 [Sorghum bicolor]KXG24850.1 hypothetical protein SORBI_3007G094000 [Sorghum bicolor]